MRTAVSFSSTMPIELMEQLTWFSTRQKVAKNKIIELALASWFEAQKKAALAAMFQDVENDPEILAMAEDGLSDLAKMLDEA